LNLLGTKPGDTVQVRPAPASIAGSWKQNVLLALLLAVATLAVYSRVNAFPFVNYDDTIYVTQNAKVQAGLTWETVRWAFTTYRVGTWHPVTWLSHALDCQWFDLDPAGPHDVNLALHVANVVLLFWILQRATRFIGRSFMVAALFALHPINVESVVWIAERKNALSMLFFLLGLAAYGWYVAKPKAGRYVIVAVAFALGLMAKPQVITFPFVLLLWDYWPLRRALLPDPAISSASNAALRNFGRLVAEKIPLFVLAGISAALTMSAQRADGNKTWYPLALRVEYAIVSYVQYLGEALWPVRLAAFYPHPDAVSAALTVGALLLLVLITALAIAVWQRRPYLLVGWLWFIGTLVPMIGLEGVGYQGKQGIADRYAYLPFIGLFVMVCWLVADWAAEKHLPAVALRVISVVVLSALGVTAYRQVSFWQDNVTLWTHALAVTNGNFLAENNLGKALINEGRADEGVAHFYKAAALYPSDPVSNLNIGIYEQKKGNFPLAIARYKTTLSVTRDPELRAAALQNMASAYRKLGDFADAQQALNDAARLSH
jgi:hypothetical protein